MHWAGVFEDGKQYAEGSLATRRGSLWCSTRATSHTPGEPESGWRLIVKGDRR